MGTRIELRAALVGPIALGVLALLLGYGAVLLPIAGRLLIGGLAILLLYFAVQTGRRRLTIDDTGVTARGVFGTSHIPWNELEHYTFWSMDHYAGYAVGAQGGLVGILAVGVIAAVASATRDAGFDNRRFGLGRLTILGQSGRKIVIDARYKKPALALDAVFDELHTRLRASGRRDYAPFGLSSAELNHATKGSLALPEIERISVAGGRMTIKKRGKRLAWAKVHMKHVRNGMLFIEELGEHGLVVDAKAGTFVPPTVLEKLHAASARHQALPAARVVRRD